MTNLRAGFEQLAMNESKIASRSELSDLYSKCRYRDVLTRAEDAQVQLDQDPLSAKFVGAALFQLGEYEKAYKILSWHKASMSTDIDYLSLVGATCRRLGMASEAMELFDAALKIDPKSAQVRNNYANLLIDVGEFPKARLILESLLKEDPDYEDARLNLNRLEFRETERKTTENEFESARDESEYSELLPGDPLMLAFREDEVKLAGALRFKESNTETGKSLAESLPNPDVERLTIDKVRLATMSIKEGKPGFALQLLSDAYNPEGAQSCLYVNAADAYIQTKRFHEAEICLLHSVVLGGPLLPSYINLVSLACMREDFGLARTYMDLAAKIDPKSPQLAKIRDQIKQQEELSARRYAFATKWVVPDIGERRVLDS